MKTKSFDIRDVEYTMSTPNEIQRSESWEEEETRELTPEEKIQAQEEEIQELLTTIRQLKSVEMWRQAHWEELKAGFESLREENAELRERLRSQTQNTQQ